MTIAASVVLGALGISATIALAALHLSTKWGMTLQRVNGLVDDVAAIKEAVGHGSPGTLARRDEMERVEEDYKAADERIEAHLRSTDRRVESISNRAHDIAGRVSLIEARK